MKPAIKLIIAIAIPLLVGAVSGYFTATSVNGWFTTINKPSFNPPNGVFAPVWTTLYVFMGVASFLVWRSSTDSAVKRMAMTLYGLQLLLNFLWSFIFFGAHELGWALFDITLLWAMILLTIIWFRKISTSAAWLLVPYLCWVSFAAILNFAIWKLN